MSPTHFATGLRQIIDRILAAIEHALPASADITVADLHTAPSLIIAWAWLHRVIQRVNRLADRVQAGPLPPSRPSRPRATPRPTPATARFGSLALPRLPGWLARLMPDPAPLTADLAEFLATPQLEPLFTQEPARFGRLLRPLCRAMGIAPPGSLRETPAPAGQIGEAPSAIPRPVPAGRAAHPETPPPASPKRPARAKLALGTHPLVPKFA